MEKFFIEYNPDPLPAEGEKYVWRQFLTELLQTILLAALIYLAINAATARIRVKSISMQPTLYESDFVVVNKLSYKLGMPGRGDIVVFRVPFDPTSEPYIKRVIGLPGDTVRIANRKVYVNDVLLDEPYIKAEPSYTGSWIVPQESLFVLGDNRNNSSDSHQWGMVPLGNVIGKAEFIYFPVSHWKDLNPATARAAGP